MNESNSFKSLESKPKNHNDAENDKICHESNGDECNEEKCSEKKCEHPIELQEPQEHYNLRKDRSQTSNRDFELKHFEYSFAQAHDSKNIEDNPTSPKNNKLFNKQNLGMKNSTTINENMNNIPPSITPMTKKPCDETRIVVNNHNGGRNDDNEEEIGNNTTSRGNIVPSVVMNESSLLYPKNLQLDKNIHDANITGSIVSRGIVEKIDVESNASSHELEKINKQLPKDSQLHKNNGKHPCLETEYDDEISNPRKRVKASEDFENNLICNKKGVKDNNTMCIDLNHMIPNKNDDSSSLSSNLSSNEKSRAKVNIIGNKDENKKNGLAPNSRLVSKSFSYWNTLGKLHKSSAKVFRWASSSNSAHPDDDDSGNKIIPPNQDPQKNSSNILFHDVQLGRVYFSSFFFKGEFFNVGDFVSSGIPVEQGDEIYRIVGVYQALKSFLGIWKKKGQCTDEIQKRGHPYALLVPLCCEKSTKFYKETNNSRGELSSQTTNKQVKKDSVEQYIPLHNELFLDNRLRRGVDKNNIYKLPIWLGDSTLSIKKINVSIISPLLDKEKVRSHQLSNFSILLHK